MSSRSHAARSGVSSYQAFLNRKAHDACSFPCDCAELEYLITSGADPNAVNIHGHTLAHVACHSHCSATLEYLLRAGASPVSVDDLGETPAFNACRVDDGASVALLIAAGDPFSAAEDILGATPQHLAAARKNHIALKVLIDAGVSLCTRTRELHDGDIYALTPAGFACLNGNSKALAMLIAVDAGHATSTSGPSALLIPALLKYPSVVALVVESHRISVAARLPGPAFALTGDISLPRATIHEILGWVV